MHSYTKMLFPALREERFVHRHRHRGHAVVHYVGDQICGVHARRCYWLCSCGGRYWC